MFRKKINFDLDEFRSRPLPSEQEITSRWTGDLAKPVVSVVCNTYNQEMYIEDAIRGFLIQETNFPFEVIINDDASTDRNPEIIKSYAEKYPSIIKPVFQAENQYSQGRKPSVVSFPHTSGAYIALCEGDDFWIAPDKLQAQYEAIDRESVGFVFSSAVAIKNDKTRSLTGQCDVKDGFVPFQRVVAGGGSFCPTASLFVRRSSLEILFDQPWFLQAPVGDLYIQAYSASYNGAYFISKPTCAYRQFAEGSWSAKETSSKEEEDFLARQLAAIDGLAKSVPDFKQSLYRDVKTHAYYHSSLRFLKCRNRKLFRELLDKADFEGGRKSRGHKIFFLFKHFPYFSSLVARLLVFR